MEFVAALVPSIGVGVLFWLAVRAIVNADRWERRALSELEKAREKPQAKDTATESRPPSG